MKKPLSLLFAAVLLLSVLWPVHGETLPATRWEAGYSFRVLPSDDGGVLSDITYMVEPEDGVVYVPKTLGGVTLTPDNFTGKVFCRDYWSGYSAFRVDDDNAWFTTIDGALYSKDGKTGIAYPNTVDCAVYMIPEGTQRVEAFSFFGAPAECIRLPDSLLACADDAFAYSADFYIAAHPGGIAESFAAANDIPFIALGEGHMHTYFRYHLEETCVSPGRILVQCPCGDVYCDEQIPVDSTAHDCPWRWDADKDEFVWEKCIYCGADPNDRNTWVACSCVCHRFRYVFDASFLKDNFLSMLPVFLYPLRLFVWRILGIQKMCICGARHY